MAAASPSRCGSAPSTVGFVTRLSQVARAAAVAIFCVLLLMVLAALAVPHLRKIGLGRVAPQNQDTAPVAHSVDLKWKASASVVVGYNVYRATQSGGPYKKLNSDPVRETHYNDTEVQAGHTYFYAVTAADSKGHESVFSSQVQAVVPSK
jgi:hypothetical protein